MLYNGALTLYYTLFCLTHLISLSFSLSHYVQTPYLYLMHRLLSRLLSLSRLPILPFFLFHFFFIGLSRLLISLGFFSVSSCFFYIFSVSFLFLFLLPFVFLSQFSKSLEFGDKFAMHLNKIAFPKKCKIRQIRVIIIIHLFKNKLTYITSLSFSWCMRERQESCGAR